STNPEWSGAGPFVERVAANLKIGHPIAESVAPFMDTSTFLTAVAFYGHMEIYPQLKVTLVHSGAAWVPLALEKSETYLWLFSGIRDVSLEPEHVLDQHLRIEAIARVEQLLCEAVPEQTDRHLCRADVVPRQCEPAHQGTRIGKKGTGEGRHQLSEDRAGTGRHRGHDRAQRDAQ